MSESDARRFGRRIIGSSAVGGAILGQFPIWSVEIEIAALRLRRQVSALCVPGLSLPHKAEGIAAFRFLNAFCYGNFGDASVFGLEALA